MEPVFVIILQSIAEKARECPEVVLLLSRCSIVASLEGFLLLGLGKDKRDLPGELFDENIVLPPRQDISADPTSL